MIHRVAQKVQQRIGYFLQHGFVQFYVLTLQHQIYQLALFTSQDTDGAMQAGSQGSQRHHADLHQLVLYLTGEASLAVQNAIEIADQGAQFITHHPDVAGCLGQFPRQKVKLGITIKFQVVKAVGVEGRLLGQACPACPELCRRACPEPCRGEPSRRVANLSCRRQHQSASQSTYFVLGLQI